MSNPSRELLLAEALDLLSIAIFIIGPDHEVAWLNQRGRSLVESRDGMSLINKRLRGDTTTQSREIDDVLDRTTLRQLLPSPGRLALARSITRRSGGRPLQLVATAVRDANSDKISPDRFAILLVGECDSHRLAHPELLGLLFGLTPTEARIAAEVANGQSLDEVARDLKLGIGTVRWHVKRIMSRTDTRRQAELVRMILLSPMSFLAA